MNNIHKILFFSATLLSILVAGCAFVRTMPAPFEKSALNRVTFFYPEFSDDIQYDGLETAIQQSIAYLSKLPAVQQFRFGKDVYDAAHMIRSLEHFLTFIQTNPSPQTLQNYIHSNYRVYRSAGRGFWGRVLFTGYYEPFLEGRLNPTPEYKYPVYARPADLITIDLSLFYPEMKGKTIIGRYVDHTVIPYYDRSQIEMDHSLEDTALPIAWVRDPVDLFFLQIQGSGKICLDNGESINVHYHISNGRPYRSIGKLLIDQGKIPREAMSMQSIRAYLTRHPEEMDAILNYNPSYIFFKTEKGGPLGFLEVPLTPGRSLALDRRIFPLAGLAFIETQKPVVDEQGNILSWSKCSRFALNQDTGGAIRGPGRADLFWGNGAYAEIAAGHMRNQGKLYFLILKPDR
jgi:membrane-bound lytic murein transglycosylase A